MTLSMRPQPAPMTTDAPEVPEFRLPRPLLRPPGVYRPQADTLLLARTAARTPIPAGARVLDICTGTGALALTAALHGAARVTALDVSRRAVLATWLNARVRNLPVRPRRSSFVDAAAHGPFDVVLANPPYVPCPPGAPEPTGCARAWDAGPDGRSLLDPICRLAPDLLAPGGFLLMVHSEVSGVDESLSALRAAGLTAGVVARQTTPFGPVMRARAGYLERAGLISPGTREEKLVVIRAGRA